MLRGSLNVASLRRGFRQIVDGPKQESDDKLTHPLSTNDQLGSIHECKMNTVVSNSEMSSFCPDQGRIRRRPQKRAMAGQARVFARGVL